jgi:hypothetical protein
MLSRPINRYFVAGAVALVLATGQNARADNTLNLQFAQPGTTSVPTLTITLNGQQMKGVEPGPYFFNVNPPPAGGGSPISTFCMELGQGVNSGSAASFTITPLNASSGTTISANNTNVQGVANALQALYGLYYNNNWSSISAFQSSSPSAQMQASAFQLAVWDLIYDGTWDVSHPNATNFFSTGNFQASTSTAEQEAQTMLNNVLNNINTGISDFSANLPGETLVALTNPTYQDQLWLEPTPKVVPGVPAPPGLFLAAVGLLTLLGRARLNRRTSAPAAV